jgi:hypothetical protein
MALRQNKTVIIGIARILRVKPHVTKKQSRHNIRRRAARTRMPTACRRRRGNGINSQLVRNPRQRFLNIRIHFLYSVILNYASQKESVKKYHDL